MSYVIEPMSLISFLEEGKLRLPRFQRKATWGNKQNFELCISVFQDYPIGVVIVNQEQKVSWLLDGRQRRYALTIMRNNPVELYEWAKSYIGFTKTSTESEIKKFYWGKVEKYLQKEESSDEGSTLDDNKDSNEDEEQDLNFDDIEENSFNSSQQRLGLTTLLDLILMVHPNKDNGSRWEQIFDFRDCFSRIAYAPVANNLNIDPKLLRTFILKLLKKLEEQSETLTKDFFIEYFIENNFDIVNRKKFEEKVSIEWDDICKSLDAIDRSEKIFADARIGTIRLRNASQLDAQNIFARINKGGTQLKAEELLSAKPYWNKTVNVFDLTVLEKIKSMYKIIGIPYPNFTVRWDIAATLISRIDKLHLIFGPYEDKNEQNISMDEITLGFKLLSSIYVDGMSAKHVNALESEEQIWDSKIDLTVNELNAICEMLLRDKFFKYYQAWGQSITKLLGNAIALEFINIVWRSWCDKGKPSLTTSSGKIKALQRESRILFDRLVYEYATKTWRGSGDSKMSNDIKNWKDRLKPIDEKAWISYIDDACNGYNNGQLTTTKILRPILYYYYVLIEQVPQNKVDVAFDVDHIIPQEVLNGHQTLSPSFKDSLINLALLPKKENIAKKSKRLNQIDDTWLKQAIMTYAQIKENDFNILSDLNNIQKLKELREPLFKDAFGKKRLSTLKN